MANRDIIAIGGSAGSSDALRRVMRALPSDIQASLFVTTHLSSMHESYLPDMLDKVSTLPVRCAIDGQPIEPGHVYIAPPDRHLLIMRGAIRLGMGPRENMVRPSIDPMFRSAALTYGPRAVGVILSGYLNDGVSGLGSIQEAGGVSVVQHPADARIDEMPRAALEAMEVDHVATSGQLAHVLTIIAATEAGPARPPPERLVFEVEVASGARSGSDTLREFADPAALTCPDCGGVLSHMRGQQPLRFRCQIGHAYTAQDLVARHELVDEAIRVAMRVMEERVELVERMGRDANAMGRTAVAKLYERRAVEYRRYAVTLRDAAMLSLRMSRADDEEPL